MNAMYENSHAGYGINTLISFRQFYDSKSNYYNNRKYCATTAEYVHNYVETKISGFLTKSDADSYYAPKKNYTTNEHLESRIEDIKNWVRNNFEKK